VATTSPARQRVILDADDIRRAITRISHEVVERIRATESLVFLGIPSRGAELAQRLASEVQRITGGDEIPVGSLDVAAYRDDAHLRGSAAHGPTVIPECGIEDRVVVLVDDVLFSGRTARAALTALDALGRPAAVQFAVLVDRGHRELPVRADYVGKNIPTARSEEVLVELVETDGSDRVLLTEEGEQS
jgi:pyrimidine operon attenuation protein/uracil phosphoribosyltransferase